MITKTVRVIQDVMVTIDETKFTPEFMKEFPDVFYPFTELNEHIKHIAQLEARGLFSDSFVEGYGPPKEMGIKVEVVDQEDEIVEE